MTVPRILVDVGMTGPTLGVELVVGDSISGLIGTGTVAGDLVWVDVTEWVRNWQFRRGATRGDGPTLRYEAGTCTIELNNEDRRFDPTNLDGPYVAAGESSIRPMVRVRIRAWWNNRTYYLFYGYADNWQLNYQANVWSTVVLTATDAMKILSSIDREESVPVGGSEDSGARIDRVLDSADWTATERVLDVGDTSLQATTLSGNALTEIQLVQDTELGEFFIDPRGRPTFRSRTSTQTRAESMTSQVTFGDGLFVKQLTFDFEFDPEWGVEAFVGTRCTLSATGVRSYAGARSMLMTATGELGSCYVTTVKKHRIDAGREYQVSFWAWSAAGATVGMGIDWWQDEVAYIDSTYSEEIIPASTWTFCSSSGTAPVGATLVAFGTQLYTPTTAGTELYIDDLVFEDLNNELPYTDVTLSTDDSQLANVITVARAGGTAQTVEDATSRARYLTQTFQRLDLLYETDEQALLHARALLYQSSAPELRFSDLVLGVPTPHAEAEVWPEVLGRDFGDRVTVIRRPPGGGDAISRDVFIRGIDMSSNGESWKTTFILQSATKFSFFVVGDPIYGVIGENALGF